MIKKICTFFSGMILAYGLCAQDKPNILWLVTEDMSPYLGCYGNTDVSTPNLDKLAKEGIRFTKAYSNGAQCSPSRSTLISGKYAVSLGTDIHREKRPVNDSFYFPIYLREAGYFCTNNAKQDYNNMKTPSNVWNESNGKANYFDRPDASQPFFAVYNQGVTHMVRVATRTVKGRSPRITSPDKVHVPGYVPDLPEVRDDISWNMDAVMMMDKWVGEKLAELKAHGEDDNTIIFFYADHGGTVPRGKAYVYESGTQVPLIVYFPPKWKHLAGTLLPTVNNRLVSFVDFAPTVLNLAGLQKPSFMVGKPFFGKGAANKENQRQYVLTYRANQSLSYAPSRGITDGHYKLIWNFQSAYPDGTRQDYQWQMPAQQAWDEAWINGKLTSDLHKKFWVPVKAFELYDVSKDSLETNDLAANPAFKKQLEQLKKVLLAELLTQKDIGFIPPEYRHDLQQQGDLFSVVRKNRMNVNELIMAAATASYRDKKNLNQLLFFLKSKEPAVQYWGASGLCGLARMKIISLLPAEAQSVFKNEKTIVEVKCMLAEAMVYLGDHNGLDYLLAGLKKNDGPAVMGMQNIGALAKPVAGDIQAFSETKAAKNKFYLRSILINCGVIPYSGLFKEDEKIGD